MSRLAFAPRAFLATAVACGAVAWLHGPTLATCLHYWPEVVELRGTLVVVHAHGYANLEADTGKWVDVPVLRLAKAIDVCGDPPNGDNPDSFRAVKALQVIIPSSINGSAFVGKRVIIKGILIEKATMHHYTDVLIHAETMRYDERWSVEVGALQSPSDGVRRAVPEGGLPGLSPVQLERKS
jgi:hypothetical protein